MIKQLKKQVNATFDPKSQLGTALIAIVAITGFAFVKPMIAPKVIPIVSRVPVIGPFLAKVFS